MTTCRWYGKCFEAAFNKEIDINSDSIKGLVVGTGYTFDQDNHKYKSSIAGEVAGTAYVAGGKVLSNVIVSYDPAPAGAGGRFSFDCDDVSWANSTLNSGANIPRGMIVYDDTPGTDATKPLIVFVDFEGDRPTTNGTLSVGWDPAGVARVTIT